MAEFGGHTEATAVDLAVEQQTRSDTRADRDDQCVVTSRGRAEVILGDSGGVGVVFADHRQSDPARHLLGHTRLAPGQMWREADDLTITGEEPGDGDTHPDDVPACGQFGDGAVEARLERRHRRGGLSPHRVVHLTLLVDDRGTDAGAPDVDTDRHVPALALTVRRRLAGTHGSPRGTSPTGSNSTVMG